MSRPSSPHPTRSRALGKALLALGLTLAGAAFVAAPAHALGSLLQPWPNPTGQVQTFSVTGPVDPSNPFFQSLGTNGRTCATCHVEANAWSLTPAEAQARFDATGGLDPLFRPVDGANSPRIDVSTIEARRAAYSMLLNRAVFRVEVPIASGAEFELVAVDDPYGFASAQHLSLFRRPLPAANLRFLSAVAWDGREAVAPLQPGRSVEENLAALRTNLENQALDATLGHAQATTPPTSEQLRQIVAFELGLFTAQASDNGAGPLNGNGAKGGPARLAARAGDFFIGINDPRVNPTGAEFDPAVFQLFTAWLDACCDAQANARAAIARGQALFNSRQFVVSGVAGFNDVVRQAQVTATCSVCHTTPGVGNRSVHGPMNTGISDAARRTPDLPLYTFRNLSTGETVQTTDPGRALVTGRWVDIGKFKVPTLRALAARAPYFHNGSAATLADVVQFYNTRFTIGLTPQEQADLVAFLQAL